MSREAKEGVIVVSGNELKTSIIEINCETDFVAKNEDFIKFVKEISELNNQCSSVLEKLKKSKQLLPVIILISAVIGSIYTGVATATEAASLGVVGALILSYFQKSLTIETFKQSLLGATKTSCMIAFILAGSTFLSLAMGFTGLPRNLAIWIQNMDLSPYVLILY